MIWESRRGKSPPKQWLADYIDYIHRTHDVNPTKEMIDEIYPHLKELWQHGATYREAARATCSVKAGKIILSAGVSVAPVRGEMKAPRNAKPGDVFGYDEMRRAGSKEAKAEKPKPAPRPAKPRVKRKDADKKPAEPGNAQSVAAPAPAPAAPSPSTPVGSKTAEMEAKLRKTGLDFGV